MPRVHANDFMTPTFRPLQVARAISFFAVAEDKITRLVEYWSEPYDAPTNRAHLVEAMP